MRQASPHRFDVREFDIVELPECGAWIEHMPCGESAYKWRGRPAAISWAKAHKCREGV